MVYLVQIQLDKPFLFSPFLAFENHFHGSVTKEYFQETNESTSVE